MVAQWLAASLESQKRQCNYEKINYDVPERGALLTFAFHDAYLLINRNLLLLPLMPKVSVDTGIEIENKTGLDPPMEPELTLGI
ncbi:hypothetical protein EVAR_68585_1 [Eumeta japonica]|uniref:Uncharacterized protein n=1 Tax=Eumeta variegata TaxID=151549 RepID=A0A4C2A7V6_EUMVA|nr:hypothetical protein EVAR_68585_1 [Eumeta japonica]